MKKLVKNSITATTILECKCEFTIMDIMGLFTEIKEFENYDIRFRLNCDGSYNVHINESVYNLSAS